MPKVSVIIPVYNTEDYLRKCLDSVCNQTLSDIEIICINDCSTDSSLEILKEYSSNDNRIKLINFDENKGAAVARNTGIDIAQGEYIGFVDSDDFIDLDFYEKLYKKATSANAEIARAVCKHVFLDKTTVITPNSRKGSKIPFNSLYGSAIYSKNLIYSYKLHFLENCNWGEDRLFPIQACYYANNIVFEDTTSYNYIRRKSSLTSSPCNKNKFGDAYLSTVAVVEFLNKISLLEKEYNELFYVFFKDLLNVYLKYYNELQVTYNNEFDNLLAHYKTKNKYYLVFFEGILLQIKTGNVNVLKSNFLFMEKELNKKILISNLKRNIFPEIGKNIPIFLSSDDNYAPFVATTIASICDNTKSFCDFYILDGGILEENKEKICELKKQFDNFSIEFIKVNLDKYFKDLPETQYISKAMYSRFLIPELKPEIDKAIYSDVDVVTLGDISKMFREDLGEYALGAVWEEYAENFVNIERKETLELSQTHKYFCSGVLLLDCKKWRENKIFDKLTNLIKSFNKKLECPDQDILNLFFDNNYKVLSENYCWINQNYNFYQNNSNIVIRHFNGPNKPWHFSWNRKISLIPSIDIFWKYAKMTSFFDEIKKRNLPKIKQDEILRNIQMENLLRKVSKC